MSHGTLWEVSVACSPELEEKVGELLETVTGQRPVICTDLRTGKTRAKIYLARGNRIPPTKRRWLAEALRRIKAGGGWPGAGRISVRRLPRENWAESWKRHFKPLEINAALLIKPSWSKRKPRKGQAVAVLDPGLSFGTGQHPTTAFCLRELAVRRATGECQSFLDIGTGSGILAIAAAKLRFSPVLAFDFDPEAVRAAKANARRNGVARRVRISRQDVTNLPSSPRLRHDVTCANLTSTLLVSARDRIVARVARRGVLVLAGILRREFAEVRRAYEAAGLELLRSKTEKGWRSGTFAFPPLAAQAGPK